MDNLVFDNRPDFKTQREEWLKWYKQYKVQLYHDKYKDIIEWESEYVAPVEFRGTWIEVTYKMGEGMLFDIKKSDMDISKSKLEEVVRSLGDIFECLTFDVEWSCPYIIQVDDHGWCHLLACKDHSKYEETGKVITRSMDIILRTGIRKTVSREGERDD